MNIFEKRLHNFYYIILKELETLCAYYFEHSHFKYRNDKRKKANSHIDYIELHYKVMDKDSYLEQKGEPTGDVM